MEKIQLTAPDNDIHANDHSISYDDSGNDSIPIIFIHGFPFDKSTWQPQMDSLKTSHRVIAYDIRGFGKSSAGSEKASIDLFADDLVKLMEALQIEKAIVCGLSMGGYILLNALNRYPEKFSAIILCDTQCIADTQEGKEKRYKTIEQIETEGITGFADTFINNIFCKDSLEGKKELVEKIRNLILSMPVVSVSGTLKALAERREMCSVLNEISIPALIICGGEDKITPLAQSVFMRSKIKDSMLRVIDHAGHMSNLEQSEEFNKYVNEFISKVVK